MKHTLTYLHIGSVVALGIVLLAGSALAIGTQSAGMNPYGYYNPYGYGYGYGYYGGSGCGSNVPYGITPYPQYPTQYCMQWHPPRWMPVQVMIPGRWEYRLVWIPAQQVTLYRPVPGYWQRTNVDGTPDVSVWWTQNGWQAAPYQPQATEGYFDSQGVWHPKAK